LEQNKSLLFVAYKMSLVSRNCLRSRAHCTC